MEAAQMATEALQRLLVVLEAQVAVDVAADLPDQPILRAFQELQGLDGWAKVTFERLCANGDDSWAMHDLHRSLEQAVGLHPRFAMHLRSVLDDAAPALPEQQPRRGFVTAH
jgi:hypothetical protein